MKDLMKGIIASLEKISSVEDGGPFFPQQGYTPFPIEDKNFHEISKGYEGRVFFIDGGNAEVLSSAALNVSFIRLYFNSFQGREKSKSHRRMEFYCIAYPVQQDGKIFYRAEFPLLNGSREILPDIMLNADDPTIRQGIFIADLSAIPGIARRFAEWKLAEYVIRNECAEGDVVVRDGTLQAGITGEPGLAESVYRAAKEKGAVVSALSKTSAMFTTAGKNLLSVLKTKGGNALSGKAWYYHPLAEIVRDDHRAEMSAAKLHPHSRHVFRLEIFKDQKDEFARIIALLAGNSGDYRFPGYPFGLLDADKFARVTEHEKRYLQSLFMFRNEDPHEILDSLVR